MDDTERVVTRLYAESEGVRQRMTRELAEERRKEEEWRRRTGGIVAG